MAVSSNRMTHQVGLILVLASALVLSACGGGSAIRNQGNFVGGSYKVGDPYQIAGQWYYPRENWDYNETGIASWYGADFDGNRTANGETYDMTLYTAAHKTLPMPIHARVTNLENGRSIMVRINDRGPFVQGRIIDLSRAAAQELGYLNNGTARVRVQAMGRAPLNTQSAEARHVMEGRRTSVASVTATPIQAASITPPGGRSTAPATTTSTRPQNVNQRVQSRTRVPGPTEIYVQAGSFSVEQNALSMLSGLRRTHQGAAVMIDPAFVGGQQFFRVRLGPYSDVTEADAVLAQVVNSGHRGARIVVD